MATPVRCISTTSERIFPQIKSLYRAPSPADPATPADRFLTLANQQNGWRSYALTRLRREALLDGILCLHRAAFCHEQRGEFRRADYFWQELLPQLSHAWEIPSTWERLARQLQSDDSPKSLRDRFATEVLVETHAGFYNSHYNTGAADPN